MLLLCEPYFSYCDCQEYGDNVLKYLQLIIPIVAAILAALLPFWYAKKKEREREYFNLEKLENYFYWFIENLIEKSELQVSNLESFIVELKKPEYSDLKLKLETGFLFEKINDLSKDPNMYKIFVLGKKYSSNNKNDYLLNIYKAVDGIEQNIKSIKKSGNLFITKFNEYRQEWNKNAELFIRSFERDIAILERTDRTARDKEIVKFYNELDKIISKWQELNTTAIKVTKDELMEPARNLCSKYKLPNYLSYIMPCIAAYNDMAKLTKDYYNVFNDIKDNIGNNKEILESELLILKNIPLKDAKKWI